ncbi:MAG: Loki-CTERM sorting domain-containing protein [Acidimicrobiia bacterium]
MSTVRTYEPWTSGSLLAGIILVMCLVAALILAVRRRNR